MTVSPLPSPLPGTVPPDDIRALFAQALSEMYRQEVPAYGTLLDVVSQVNADVLQAHPEMAQHLRDTGEWARLAHERHGAIRLGTAEELALMRRVFAVMGMLPVGYYDLSAAGVPVHSTAFRPVGDEALARSPFRVFTSLLRLELIDDPALRSQAARTLARRRILSDKGLALVHRFEQAGGLQSQEAGEFVAELCDVFRWHGEATVSLEAYQRFQAAHRLIADIVCFGGPHINHLTPATLDIDAAQQAMRHRGLAAKQSIEGPPRRHCPILLRQTSFHAMAEPIRFAGGDGAGTHTARFGEIEQRGMALTREGRALYDELLGRSQEEGPAVFSRFPDDLASIRREGLGFFRYVPSEEGLAACRRGAVSGTFETWIEDGLVRVQPIVYEDFLPVSAAGIFQSNLGGAAQQAYQAAGARAGFEAALGARLLDEIQLYEAAQQHSVRDVTRLLGGGQTLHLNRAT